VTNFTCEDKPTVFGGETGDAGSGANTTGPTSETSSTQKTQTGGFKVVSVSVPKAPENLVNFFNKASGALDPLITALSAASTLLDVVKAFLVDLQNPSRSVFLKLVEELQDLISDISAAGVYSIYIPFPANEIKRTVDSIIDAGNDLQEALENRKETESLETFKAVFDSLVDLSDPYNAPLGGTYRIESLLTNAFFDQYDPNRPEFSDDAKMGGVFAFVDTDLFGAPQFIEAILKLIGSLFDVVASLPIQGLESPDYTVASLPGRVEVRWNDNTSILPPRHYIVLRSTQPNGIPPKKDTKEGGDVEKSEESTPVREWEIVDIKTPFEQLADIMNEDYIYEDVDAPSGVTHYYTVVKTWKTFNVGETLKSPPPADAVSAEKKLVSRVEGSKAGVRLGEIILKTKISKETTTFEQVVDTDVDKLINIGETSQKVESIRSTGTADRDPIELQHRLNFLRDDSKIPVIKLEAATEADFRFLATKNGKVFISTKDVDSRSIGDASQGEIFYYESAFVDGTSAILINSLRAREGTFALDHSIGSFVFPQGKYTPASEEGVEPNFLPPISVGVLFPLLGQFFDQINYLLEAIANGFVTASENLEEFIEAIDQNIEKLLASIAQVQALLENIAASLTGISLTAIVLPAQSGGTRGLVNRLSAAFNSDDAPETSMNNLASGFGVFYGGPTADGVEKIINSIFIPTGD
jgi:hypothetical protein